MKSLFNNFIFLIFLFTMGLSLSSYAKTKNIEHEALRFSEDFSAMAQVAVWKDKSLSAARYATNQAVYWYEKQIGDRPSPKLNPEEPPLNEFFLIFLGQTEKEIWTLEGGIADDGAGDLFFDFVRTSKNGKRIQKRLLKFSINQENRSFDSKQLHKKLLNQLWKETNKLGKQDSKLKPIEIAFDLRSFEVKKENNVCSVQAKIVDKTLCYFITHQNYMCWYLYEWKVRQVSP